MTELQLVDHRMIEWQFIDHRMIEWQLVDEHFVTAGKKSNSLHGLRQTTYSS
jgi:hypothetical protein